MTCSASVRTVDSPYFQMRGLALPLYVGPQAHTAHREWTGMELEFMRPPATWGLAPRPHLSLWGSAGGERKASSR